MASFFNLLAELISELKVFPTKYDSDALTPEDEEALKNDVMSLLNRWEKELNNCAKNGLLSDAYDDIIIWAKNRNDFHSYRALICMLDTLPHTGLKAEISKDRDEKFFSLNNNADQTGILILPQVHTPSTTYIKPSSKEHPAKTEPRKNANEWSDSLNARLNHIYYVCTNELNGYSIGNYVCNFSFDDPSSHEIRIGVAPLLNLKLNDVLSYSDNIRCKNESGRECQYFNVTGVKVRELILAKVHDCIKLACEQNVDILMFPEMLGIEDFYDLDPYGFNPNMKNLRGYITESAPYLTIMPSIWKDNHNFLNVYLASARKLCSQHKQHRYIFPGTHGAATENLINIPREVSLIHIPGWGRIAIPICMDFLHSEYTDWLVTTLKASILLCPSYSPSNYHFLQFLDSNTKYGTHTIWLNSCSALHNAENGAPEIVGAACSPSVSSDSRIARFIPKCNGDCSKACLFVVTIPLNCIGESIYEERLVHVKHERSHS